MSFVKTAGGSLRDLALPVAVGMPPYARLADKLGDLLITAKELAELAHALNDIGLVRRDVSAPIEDFANRLFDEAKTLMADLTE
jgi:hypothetical protein